ncbi:MAG: FAD-binding protein, partial [Actinomycetes bacterium]
MAAVVALAGAAGLGVAARGAGHSTYGQAQVPGGIVIDMTPLNHVGEVHAGRVTAQAGACWSEILDVALTQGYTPPMLTDYLHTTIGGTLTVGGVGGTTHRHGMQVDGVEELSVVTGRGQLVTCSAERNRRLFDAVRAGLGQCGIITGVTLRLTSAPARVRWHRLHYRDLAKYLGDQRELVLADRFDYIEGQVVLAEPRGWRYVLEVAIFDPPPGDLGLLGGLGHERDDIEDISYREFQHRMAAGEAALRASG